MSWDWTAKTIPCMVCAETSTSVTGHGGDSKLSDSAAETRQLEATRVLVESGTGVAAGCLGTTLRPRGSRRDLLLADDRSPDVVFRDGSQVPSEEARLGVA